MSKYKTEDIRNIALVGHRAAGKTTLADALLFKAGAVDRRGSVDDGTSVSDYDEEEHHRKFSIDSHLLHANHHGKEINLIDTPGYPDFVGAALGALPAVETAVIVVSAPAGIEVNARRMFNEAGKRGLARMIVINKLDADNIHFAELLGHIRETFGKGCVLFNAPVGVGAKLSGVVDVLNPPASPPADVAVDLAAAKTQLIEAAIEIDDALTEKFLMEEPISKEELEAVIPKSLAAGKLVPIFCTSGKKDVGVAELLEGICNDALSPVQAQARSAKPAKEGEAEVAVAAERIGRFSGPGLQDSQ